MMSEASAVQEKVGFWHTGKGIAVIVIVAVVLVISGVSALLNAPGGSHVKTITHTITHTSKITPPKKP